MPRSTSCAVSLETGANTVAIATFTHTSIGPSSASALRCRRLDGFGVRDVGRDGKGAHAMGRPQLGSGALQPIRIACQQRHVIAVLGELLDGRPAHASTRARHDDDLGHVQILCRRGRD